MIERDSRRRRLQQCARFAQEEGDNQSDDFVAGDGRDRRRRRRIPCRLLLAVAAPWNSVGLVVEAAPFVYPRAASAVFRFADLQLATVQAVFPANTARTLRLRGGDDGSDDGNNSVPLPEGDNLDSSPNASSGGGETSDEDSTKARNRTPFGLSSAFPSLFQLNNNVKYDASLDDDYEGSPLASPLTSSRTTNGRGGAMMVKTKPQPESATSTPPRRMFQWLAPLETDRVAPLAARLILDDGVGVAINSSEDAVDNDGVRETASNDRLTPTPATASSSASSGRDEIDAASRSPRRRKSETRESDEESRHKSRMRNELLLAMEKETMSRERPAASSDAELAVDISSEARPEENVTTSDKVDQLPSDEPLEAQDNVTSSETQTVIIPESPYVSSGYWSSIDKALTLGFADSHPAWRVSRRLRSARKATARVTGLHGFLSGKQTMQALEPTVFDSDDQRMGVVRRRIAEIARARENVDRITAQQGSRDGTGFWPWSSRPADTVEVREEFQVVVRRNRTEILEEKRRKARVKQIDKLIAESQQRLQELACEKDMLQRRPNPLWNYTTSPDAIAATRRFNFPPPDLVEEYLDIMFGSGKLVRLNHTDLWRNNVDLDDDEYEDDELVDRRKVDTNGRKRRTNGDEGSGNWLLRYGLGEKIGEAAETAAYKSVCSAVMSVLARGLSSLHGLNVMSHSDIRLFMEQTPGLPPLAAGIIPGSGRSNNYAQGAIENAMRKGSKKRKRKKRSSDDPFIQRGAVVETLLSHCQISAPLLKLFPLAWQRAMLGNIITLVTAIMADFFEGMEFRILGHRLSFSFSPISESDMLRSLGSSAVDGFDRHRVRPEQFEAAVRVTAADLEEELKFLDRWHERILGSGMLRTQIANLIARLVLVLVDDVLSGARMDLWTSQAGGPRLVAGLEYRTSPTFVDEAAATAAALSPLT